MTLLLNEVVYAVPAGVCTYIWGMIIAAGDGNEHNGVDITECD